MGWSGVTDEAAIREHLSNVHGMILVEDKGAMSPVMWADILAEHHWEHRAMQWGHTHD